MQQEQWRRVNRTRACASRHASDWSVGDGVRHRDGGKKRGTGRRRLRANNLARGPVDGVAVLVMVVNDGVIMRQRADVSHKCQCERRQHRDDQPVAAPPRLHARQITAWAGGCPPNRCDDHSIRNLERAGVSRSVAMKLTGHKTESIYRRYAIVSEADLHEAVSKLARLVHDAGTKTGTADASVGTRVRRKLAEGEAFEPPRASRPG